MIVADSSALIAILEEEPEHLAFKEALRAADRRAISAVSVYETRIVILRRRGPDGLKDVAELVDAFGFEVVPFDAAQAEAASEAYARYGKSFDARAKLNMGDCATYALAKSMAAPLLFKGDDFTHTDARMWR